MPTVRTGDFDCAFADDWFGPPWVVPEVVLVQHGFGRNGEYWRHWVPALADTYRVIRRDMRAHGGSSAGSPDHVWSPETLADDVVAFLDALGLGRVHYVGESVGGITGIVLGARHPDRLHTLTLVQTPIRLGRLLQDAMRGSYPTWAAALRELGPGGWVVRNMPVDSPDGPVRARVAWERAQWDRCDAEALARLADATLHVDVDDLLADVRVPTLLLAPARSELTPLADQLRLRTTIPDAEIEVFEGRGHTVYQDEPDRCTARIRRFLAARGFPVTVTT
jgi:pimeloyl-ACP methyl ester carboxylesterase